jgi:hypothetical protein
MLVEPSAEVRMSSHDYTRTKCMIASRTTKRSRRPQQPRHTIGPLTIIGQQHMIIRRSAFGSSTRFNIERPISESHVMTSGKYARCTVRELLRDDMYTRWLRGSRMRDDELAEIQRYIRDRDRKHNVRARWRRALWRLRLRSALWQAAERGAAQRLDQMIEEDRRAFVADLGCLTSA